MTRISKLLLLSALFVVVAVPLVASAQTVGPTQANQGGGTFGGLFPIVPCGTAASKTPCTPCGLLDVLENIVKFVTVGVTGPVAALLFIYAGVLFLTSAGNTTRVQQAKKVLTNTVYGVTIILLSWLVVVQLVKIVAPGSSADRWYEFNCPAALRGVGEITETEPRDVGPDGGAVQGLGSVACTDLATIAAAYGGNPNPQPESPAIARARECLLADPVVQAMTDTNHLFTFEVDKPWCNASRGIEVPGCPGSCAHGNRTGISCHYGGKRGTDGAEAVDFNWNNRTVLYSIVTRQVMPGESEDEQALALIALKDEQTDDAARARVEAEWQWTNGEYGLNQAILYASQNGCKDAGVKIKRVDFERAPGDGHTHISVAECDSDGPLNSNYDVNAEQDAGGS